MENTTCPNNFLPLPAGWGVAPNNTDSLAVAFQSWGWADYLVMDDGSAYLAYIIGGFAGSDNLITCEAGTITTGGQSLMGDSCPVSSDTTYTVSGCTLPAVATMRTSSPNG